ncbi:MAG: hypothetical protein K6G61_07965 [Solobacterium sp.]|nr:hypothetical protein [Solobacterium sp.]
MEEMNELFYREPYTREFEAEVIRCDKGRKYWEVVLDDTAFYPEGGGQPADHGMIGDVPVIDVHRKGDEILHYTEGPVEAGTKVRCVIDWDRRFDHMQNHSGEHIVSGLIHRTYGYENVGFHMGDLVQIDFDGPLTWEQVRDIERRANAVIWENIPVQELFPDEEELQDIDYRSKKELQGKVRIIQISGADTCACCGTHVHRTGEIGLIRLLHVIRHKSGVRIDMVSGKRALQYDEAVFDQNHEISVALSAPETATADAVKGILNQNVQKGRRFNDLAMKYFEAVLKTAPENEKVSVIFCDGLDRTAMRKGVNTLLQEKNASAAAVLSLEDSGYAYVILSHQADLRKCTKALNERLQGRGGGNAEMIQGTFQASAEEIETAVKEVLTGLF